MKKAAVVCWDFLILTNTLGLFPIIFLTIVWPVAEGKDIFSVSFWLSMLDGLTPLNILMCVVGYPLIYCYAIYKVFTNFSRPVLCVFKRSDISLYTLRGIRKILWSKVQSIDIKQIENLKGKMSKSFKFFEVTLQFAEENQLKFQFETFSNTKVSLILDIWRASQVNHQLRNEE